MQMKFLLAKEESGRKQPKKTALESPETSSPELRAKWNQTSFSLSNRAELRYSSLLFFFGGVGVHL